MVPRVDPETRPAAVVIQLIRRRPTDQYGNEKGHRKGAGRGARFAGHEPMETRNGLPFRPYVYRGTGESLTFSEAKECLLCSD